MQQHTIVVAHNATLIGNADADQVIVANYESGNLRIPTSVRFA
jgi:hypothetical protein